MVQKLSFNRSAKSTTLHSTNTFPKSSPSSPILFGTAKASPTSPLSDPKHKKRPRKASEENDEDSDYTHNSPSLKRWLALPKLYLPLPRLPCCPGLLLLKNKK